MALVRVITCPECAHRHPAVLRLDKLLYDGPNENGLAAKAALKARRDYERLVVAWTDDSLVTLCPDCTKAFGMLRRKHHCRLCGSIICTSPPPLPLWSLHAMPHHHHGQTSGHDADWQWLAAAAFLLCIPPPPSAPRSRRRLQPWARARDLPQDAGRLWGGDRGGQRGQRGSTD